MRVVDSMGGRIRSAALALSLLLLVPLGQADGRTAAPQRPDPPETGRPSKLPDSGLRQKRATKGRLEEL